MGSISLFHSVALKICRRNRCRNAQTQPMTFTLASTRVNHKRGERPGVSKRKMNYLFQNIENLVRQVFFAVIPFSVAMSDGI